MTDQDQKLVVLWSSGDREVALEMVLMYTLNAKLHGWWNDIVLILWGPSQKLVASDGELQGRLRKMLREGIAIEACKACADDYGVSEKLVELGVDVKFMGVPLTEYVKQCKVLTF